MNSVQVAVNLIGVECCECACIFGVAETMLRELNRTGKTFYCPNGHTQCFGDGENARLKHEAVQLKAKLDQEKARRLDQERAARKAAESHKRTEAMLKGHVTRLKNKVAAGACPCCDKTFPDLAAHMAADHPEYETQEGGS